MFSDLARWLARGIWFHSLYLMRRPWMRRLQRRWMSALPEARRQAAWNAVLRQNRLARRYGLPLLTLVCFAFIASVALTLAFFGALWLLQSGVLVPPQ